MQAFAFILAAGAALNAGLAAAATVRREPFQAGFSAAAAMMCALGSLSLVIRLAAS